MRSRFFVLPILMLAPAAAQAQDLPTASATFIDAEGEAIGSAELTGTPEGVLIELEVSGLPGAGWVAFHIHEHGTCSPDDDHESAGEHFNPDGREHGYLAPTGPHIGDMPNLYVPEDGVLRAHVFNGFVDLEDGDTGVRGRALMLHADGDDYVSQPSGEAGDRIACAVIE